jgi:hypothetical protein
MKCVGGSVVLALLVSVANSSMSRELIHLQPQRHRALRGINKYKMDRYIRTTRLGSLKTEGQAVEVLARVPSTWESFTVSYAPPAHHYI